jgi:PST family polysaccharide transporter
MAEATLKTPRRWYGRTLRRGAAWSVSRQTVRGLIQIPTTIILARLLSPTDFGIAAAAAFFTQLGSRLSQFGLNAALLRSDEVTPLQASSAFVASLAFGTAAYAAIFLGADTLGGIFNSADTATALRVAGVVFLIAPFGTIPSALQNRSFQFRALAAADFADVLVGATVSVGCAFAGFGFFSIVYGHICGTIARAATTMVLARWHPSLTFSFGAVRHMVAFGSGVQAKRLLEYGGDNLDTLVVGRLLGLEALGFYDKAYSSMSRILQRLTIAPAVSFRVFALIQEEPQRFLRAYQRVLLTVTLVGAPLFFGAAAAAPELFDVLFGVKWRPAVLPFQILAVSGLLRLMGAYAAPANEAAGRIWSQVTYQGLHVALIVALVMAGTRWGVSGAAGAVLAAVVILQGLTLDLLRRTMAWRFSDMVAPTLPGLALGAVLAIAQSAARAGLRSLGVFGAGSILVVQVLLGAALAMLFIVLCPLQSVREVILDFADDGAPPVARWLRRLGWTADGPASNGPPRGDATASRG